MAENKTNNNGHVNYGIDLEKMLAEAKDIEMLDIELPPPYIEIDGCDEKKRDDEERGDDDDEEDDKKVDKYDVRNIDLGDDGPAWAEMSNAARAGRIFTVLGGVCFALALLYIFICALDVLTSAFQLLAGRVAGSALSSNVILNNPMAGLVLGVLATVLLQSSSTSTSIVVTLVGSGVLTVQQAIYIIMGANIGTSVTNTIVAMTQSGDKDRFRRSFAGATVHDMFNWLTVIILLPIEAGSHYLYHLTKVIVKTIKPKQNVSMDEPQFLKVITNPLTNRIIKIDKHVMSAVAEGSDGAKYPICRYYCDMVYDHFSESWPLGQENETFVDEIRADRWTLDIELTNDTDRDLTHLTWRDINHNASTLCTHHFTGCGVEGTWCSLSDQAVGGILFGCSLVVLLTAVVIMVKVLNLILRGPMAKAIRVGINASLPGKAKFLTGYLAMLLGAGITMLVQSSSVFTSTMTPLVGMGLVSVERMYPLTLGSNIGTCLTGIMAALTADGEKVLLTLQVAFAHLFFNISGIILFYPVPHLRKLPLGGAKFLGNTTANYKWFAIAYIVVLFFVMPLAIFGLSMAGWRALVGVLVPIGTVVILIVVIKCMQRFCPLKLPKVLRNWHWLPKPLRSLEPCHRNVIVKCCYTEGCIRCRRRCGCGAKKDPEDEPDSQDEEISIDHSQLAIIPQTTFTQLSETNSQYFGHSNPAFTDEPVHHSHATSEHTKL